MTSAVIVGLNYRRLGSRIRLRGSVNDAADVYAFMRNRCSRNMRVVTDDPVDFDAACARLGVRAPASHYAVRGRGAATVIQAAVSAAVSELNIDASDGQLSPMLFVYFAGHGLFSKAMTTATTTKRQQRQRDGAPCACWLCKDVLGTLDARVRVQMLVDCCAVDVRHALPNVAAACSIRDGPSGDGPQRLIVAPCNLCCRDGSIEEEGSDRNVHGVVTRALIDALSAASLAAASDDAVVSLWTVRSAADALLDRRHQHVAIFYA